MKWGWKRKSENGVDGWVGGRRDRAKPEINILQETYLSGLNATPIDHPHHPKYRILPKILLKHAVPSSVFHFWFFFQFFFNIFLLSFSYSIFRAVLPAGWWPLKITTRWLHFIMGLLLWCIRRRVYQLIVLQICMEVAKVFWIDKQNESSSRKRSMYLYYL